MVVTRIAIDLQITPIAIEVLSGTVPSTRVPVIVQYDIRRRVFGHVFIRR